MPNRNIGRAIGNLLGGVSQQPTNSRFLNMAAESVNALPSIARGLDKRPGSNHIGVVYYPASIGGGIEALSHFINRDSGEKYSLNVYRAGSVSWAVKVMDIITGAEVPIYADSSGTALGTELNDYLDPAAYAEESVGEAQDDLRFMTVGDTTFLLNRRRICKVRKPAIEVVEVSADESWNLRVLDTSGGTFTLSFEENVGGTWLARTTGPIAYTTGPLNFAVNIDAALEAAHVGGGGADFSVVPTGVYIAGEEEEYLVTDTSSGSSIRNLAVSDISSLTGSASSPQENKALVMARAGVYGQKYEITLNGSAVRPDFRDVQPGIDDGMTPDGSSGIHSRYIGPDVIVERMMLDVNGPDVIVTQLTGGTWKLRIINSTGGSFRLDFEEYYSGSWLGRTTADIAYSSNPTTLAANIDAALESAHVGGGGADFTVVQSGAYVQGSVEEFVVTAAVQTVALFDLNSDTLTGPGGGWITEQTANVASIEKTSGAAFTIEPSDANYGVLMSILHGDVESVSDLPLIAPDGFKVKMAGSNDDGADDWYAEFVADTPGTFGRGSWKEAVGWSSQTAVNGATMPHVFRSYVKSSVGTHPPGLSDGDPYFVFERFSWSDRIAGDDESNPIPSVFDNRLDAMGFHRGRLLLMTGESLVTSEAGGPENIFRISVESLLDTDRIDLTSQIRDASDFRAFVEHNEKGVLFSDNSQVVLDSAGALLTPGTAGLQVAGSAITDPDGGPVTSGAFIFAPFRRGYIAGQAWTGHSGVYQMVDVRGGESLRLEPFDITSHCPYYIKGRIVELAVSSTENLLAVLTESRDTIYLYRWQDEGERRVQGAWQKMDIGQSYAAGATEIISMAFIESSLYVATWRDTEGMGYCIERVEFASGAVDDDFWCQIRLDNKVRHDQIPGTTVVLSGADTIVTFPAGTWKRRGDGATGVVYAVTADVAGQAGGAVHQSDTPGGGGGGTSVVVFPKVDLTATDFYIGVKYEMRHTMSHPYLEKEAADGGKMALVTGRTRISRAFIDIAEAGEVKVEVTQNQPGGGTSSRTFTHGTGAGLDVVPFERTEVVPIDAKNNKYDMVLINDSPFGSRFNGVEYEANYHGRSQRIG